MIGWLGRLLGRGRGESAERPTPRPRKHNIRVECPTCGYEADESEFLQKDMSDTICPKCGEDTPIYEL